MCCNSRRLRTYVAPILTVAGMSLLLILPDRCEASTWDGGGANGNWGTAANWDDNQVPGFPTDLTFSGSAGLTSTNDLGNVSVDGLTFDSSAGSFSLGGDAFTLGDTNVADYRRGGINQESSSSQTIGNNLTIARGEHEIVASGSGNLSLTGTISREAGATVRFSPAAGMINTTLTNNAAGMLGGWATIQNPSPAFEVETLLFAKVDGSGNVVPYLDYDATTNINSFSSQGNEQTFPAGTTATTNLRWFGGDDANGEVLTMAAPGTTDINTFLYEQDLENFIPTWAEVNVGDGNTLRFADEGGIFRSNPNGQQNQEYLRFTGGTITAGHSSSPASLYFWTSTHNPGDTPSSEHHNFTIHLSSTAVTDNPDGGAVSVVKSGPGAVRTSAAGHSFTGGLYLNRGVWRAQANMETAFGAGPVYVASGAQAYVNADGTVPNDFYLNGTGIDEGTFFVGAMRIAADGAILTGTITLTANTRLGNRGAQASNADFADADPTNDGVRLQGKITGDFDLELSVANGQGGATIEANMPTMVLENTANDWGGNTTIGRGRTRIGGTGEVIPNGSGKGNLTLLGETDGPTILSLDGLTETVNGLSSSGDESLIMITNSLPGVGTLRVGDNDASSTFGGAIIDDNVTPDAGDVALTKIGAGTLTLTGANAYEGDTRVQGGALSINSAYLADAADVYLSSGAVFNLNFSGTDTIDSLFINGVGQATGTWGSMSSTATNKSDLFSGNGLLNILTVGVGGGTPGDFDNDGDVDGTDFLIWQRGGSPTPGSAGDLADWKANYGTALAVNATAVPEPTAWTLFAFAAMGTAAGGRKRMR